MPVWRQLGTGDDGNLYGVVLGGQQIDDLVQLARPFAGAGVEPPKTWGELKMVAEMLAAGNIAPFSVAAHEDAGWTLTDWFENIYLQTVGPQLYDQLTKGRNCLGPSHGRDCAQAHGGDPEAGVGRRRRR